MENAQIEMGQEKKYDSRKNPYTQGKQRQTTWKRSPEHTQSKFTERQRARLPPLH